MFIMFSPLVLALLSAIVLSLLRFRARSTAELLRVHVATGRLTAYSLAPIYMVARVILLVVAVCCRYCTSHRSSVHWTGGLYLDVLADTFS
jgi:fumarate reductase subunit D